MTQNTEQNVRTQAATWAVVAPTGKVISIHDDEVEAVRAKQSHWAAVRHCLLTETEARGAEEQRRKVENAQGGEVVYLRYADYEGWCFCAKDEYETVEEDEDKRILYTRPANVATLEARVKELEKALSFYADPSNYIDSGFFEGDPDLVTPKCIPVLRHGEDGSPCDCGDTARTALTREGGV